MLFLGLPVFPVNNILPYIRYDVEESGVLTGFRVGMDLVAPVKTVRIATAFFGTVHGAIGVLEEGRDLLGVVREEGDAD